MKTSIEPPNISFNKTVQDPLLDSVSYDLSGLSDITFGSTAASGDHEQPASHGERAALFLRGIAEQRASATLAKISLWLDGPEDELGPDHYQPSACPESQKWINANEDTLRDLLMEDFLNLSREHIGADRGHFESALGNDGTNDAFKLHELAYMGIESVVESLKQARDNLEEISRKIKYILNDMKNQRLTFEKINELSQHIADWRVAINVLNGSTAKLISATAVRAFYLSDIVKDFKQADGTNLAKNVFTTQKMQHIREHTKNLDQDELEPYGEVFKQNILSATYSVVRLADTKQQHADEPPASNHQLPNQLPQPSQPALEDFRLIA